MIVITSRHAALAVDSTKQSPSYHCFTPEDCFVVPPRNDKLILLGYLKKCWRTLPDAVGSVVGDKDYDIDAILEALAEWEMEAVIPTKKNRKQTRKIDENFFEDRNKVQRLFLKIKDNRAVATRYDKKAACY